MTQIALNNELKKEYYQEGFKAMTEKGRSIIEFLLKNAHIGFILLAEVDIEEDTKVIGTVAVNFEWSDWRN